MNEKTHEMSVNLKVISRDSFLIGFACGAVFAMAMIYGVVP